MPGPSSSTVTTTSGLRSRVTDRPRRGRCVGASVLDEVAHRTRDERAIAADPPGEHRRVSTSGSGSVPTTSSDDLFDVDDGQVIDRDRRAVEPRHVEQVVDDAAEAAVGVERATGRGLDVTAAQPDLEQRLHRRHRRAQLVRRIADERSLPFARGLETLEHVVHRARELVHLVVGGGSGTRRCIVVCVISSTSRVISATGRSARPTSNHTRTPTPATSSGVIHSSDVAERRRRCAALGAAVTTPVIEDRLAVDDCVTTLDEDSAAGRFARCRTRRPVSLRPEPVGAHCR